MTFKSAFEKINFAQRYRELCDSHYDFENRMSGMKTDLYEKVLGNYPYKFKYYSKGNFFQVLEEINDISFMLNIILKDGLVESLLYIKSNNMSLEPGGRLDFLPEDLGIPFERKTYNLPNYVSGLELIEILNQLFSIYEDLKWEVVKIA